MLKRFLKSILPEHVVKSLSLTKYKLKLRSKIMPGLPLRKKRSKIRFEIHLTEHCNLNCAGCNNFSCIAEHEFIDCAEFRRDMSRMGEIFNNECERIYLLGGEPLLHPQISTLVKTARESFTRGNIFVFTNGILLSKQPPEFWETCRDYRTDILISAYPVKIDTDTIKSLAEKYGVNVNWAWGQNEGQRNTFAVSQINLAGNSSVKLNYAMCGRANNCITLKHGRLFTCTFAPHVEHFNRRFHQNISITEEDSINIYDNVSADDILERLAKPIPACRYCMTDRPAKYFTWTTTKHDINEWL